MSLPPQKNGNNGRMTPAGIEPASQPWKGRITNRLDHGAMHGSIAATLYIFERLLMLHRIFPCSRKIGIWTQICGFGDHRAATYTILLFFRPCRIWSWRESNPCPELVLMQNLCPKISRLFRDFHSYFLLIIVSYFKSSANQNSTVHDSPFLKGVENWQWI